MMEKQNTGVCHGICLFVIYKREYDDTKLNTNKYDY